MPEETDYKKKLLDVFSKKPEEKKEDDTYQKAGEAISKGLDPEKAKKFKFGG